MQQNVKIQGLWYLTEAACYHGINAKKTEFYLSYGNGAINDNIQKCAQCARIVYFCMFLQNAP